jgi:hypothetical protein
LPLDYTQNTNYTPSHLLLITQLNEYVLVTINHRSPTATTPQGEKSDQEAMYAHTPPAPPPKPPGNHEVSRMSTPAGSQLPRPPPLPEAMVAGLGPTNSAVMTEEHATQPRQQDVADPGDQWLPVFLQDKSYVFRRLQPRQSLLSLF